MGSTICCSPSNNQQNYDNLQESKKWQKKEENKKNKENKVKIKKQQLLKDQPINLQKYNQMGEINDPGLGSVLYFNYQAEIGFLSPSQFRVKKILSQIQGKGNGNWKNAIFVGDQSLIALSKIVKNLGMGDFNDWGFLHIVLITNMSKLYCKVVNQDQKSHQQMLQAINYKKSIIKYTEKELDDDKLNRSTKISQNALDFQVIENLPNKLDESLQRQAFQNKRLAIVISIQASDKFQQNKDKISRYISQFKQKNLRDDDDLMCMIVFNQEKTVIIKA